MGKNSQIEWTDHTFNPWIGCTKVSPGCENCYAEKMSKRRNWASRELWGKGKPRHRTTDWQSPLKWNQEAGNRRRRLRVFCASLADVFDSEVDPKWRSDLWDLIQQTPFLDWLLLTKRPENIKGMLPANWGEGWTNVCLMTSVEDQHRTNRINSLIEIPARYRALSMEPLLGPVHLEPEWLKHLNWVIVGGESEQGARPMHPEWVRALRQQCADHNVDFFFKQWGCWSPEETAASSNWTNAVYFDSPSVKPIYLNTLEKEEQQNVRKNPAGKVFLFRTSKGVAGNLLDDVQHLEHPFGKRIPKKEISVPLNSVEKKHLERCEKIIQAGLRNFVEVGTALMEIRNKNLHRETHASFEEYVRSIFSMSRPHAYSLMDSAQVMHDLSSIADIPLPANEAQPRELRHLKSPAERAEKWKQVVSAAGEGPITAKLIRDILSPSLQARKATCQNLEVALHATIKKLRFLVNQSLVMKQVSPLLDQLEQLIECKTLREARD